jgi:hypothetical protein
MFIYNKYYEFSEKFVLVRILFLKYSVSNELINLDLLNLPSSNFLRTSGSNAMLILVGFFLDIMVNICNKFGYVNISMYICILIKII